VSDSNAVRMSPELADKVHSLICEVVGAWNIGSVVTHEVRGAVRQWLIDVADYELAKHRAAPEPPAAHIALIKRIEALSKLRREAGQYGTELDYLDEAASALRAAQPPGADVLRSIQQDRHALHTAFLSWWFDHHEDARFFNEAMRLDPLLAAAVNERATLTKEV
jgi:hypothetical protein